MVAGPYLSRQVQNSGALYGTFALVLALIGWIYLVSLALILSAEVNVTPTCDLSAEVNVIPTSLEVLCPV